MTASINVWTRIDPLNADTWPPMDEDVLLVTAGGTRLVGCLALREDNDGHAWDEWCAVYCDGLPESLDEPPTHWMTLPAAPEATR